MAKRVAEYPVPLVLKKILKDRVTGELLIKGDKFEKKLVFVDGKLTFARTNVIQERLGEILFKIGKITPAQFWNIQKIMSDKKAKVGKLLVQSNILSQRELYDALQLQVKTIALSTFSINSGEWEFLSDKSAKAEEGGFLVPLSEIILEGTMKMKNLGYFRNRYHYHSPKLSPIPDYIKITLPESIITFFDFLGRHDNKSNEQIIAAANISEDLYWRNIILLFLLNAVEFVELEIEQNVDKNIEEMLAFYDQLKDGKLDYYNLFGLKSNASVDDIRNVYFQYAKKYHPDRVSWGPDPEIKEKSNFVFSEINKAYDILGNERKRREYDLKGHIHEGFDEAGKDRMMEKARNLYRKAKTLYSQQKYWEAVALLDEAVRLSDDKAAYYLLLGLCQLHIPEMRRMAEKNLQQAIQLENWNVDAYAALGLLFIAENQIKRAEGFFKKALSLNPDHALSQKKLAELQGDHDKKKRFSFFGKSK